MTVSEGARHELFQELEQVLGRDKATTLMEMRPPAGWADVARTRDLDALAQRIDLRFDRMEYRFESIDHRFDAIDHRFESIDHRFDAIEHRMGLVESGLAGHRAQLWTMFLGLVGLQITGAGVAVTLAKLL